ncbi:hypothetical protein K1T71_009530 [Dendrolimus kikuchii]|uniref:Uncharacterized protein n=1 Tax=Dendrolimus kikuchii TaxID=765133 RepID=A0ACC1CS38_9NEOP|nr:hypothetical protein K1T71_009530 [Dendrolimus kikuchii]
MYAKKDFICAVMFLVILILCDGSVTITKVKRHVKSRNSKILNNFRPGVKNTTIENSNRGGKGFFFNSGIFTLGKVLNFFPVGGEKECQPTGYNVAKAGICLNAYDCRQRDGRAAGDCAHGLGACCVFEVSCGGVVQNNITYFMSPGFPELWNGDEDCNITIDKTHAGIMQLKIDFIHFTLGQPNRRTGECDEDAMILGDGETNLTLCGQNHGQHVYYTLSSKSESREDEDLQGSVSTTLSMRMRGGDMPRLWLMRLAQMPLAHSAPHQCLQYYTSDNGTIKTFNFAINGRHLAGMQYQSCIRRNSGFCSIRYMPCDDRSFRIGPSGNMTSFDPAEYVITTAMNTMSPPSTSATPSDLIAMDTQNG